MSWLRQLVFRVTALWRRRNLEAEMAEEMRQHLEIRIRENLEGGMAPDEARLAAQRTFGGLTLVQERCRDERRFIWLEQLAQDLRFAARALRKSPGFTAVAVLTLAFGIGVNTSMFTALQFMLLRELPCPDPDGLVQVFRTSPQSQRGVHSAPNFLEQQAQNEVFERMAAVARKSFNLAEPGEPAESVGGAQVSTDLFPLLGVPPVLGRFFSPEIDPPGSNGVVVLGHGLWLRRFGGDPGIVGRVLRIDGAPVTVVGVMPAAFRDLPVAGRGELWQPITFTREQRESRGSRSGNYLESVARLKPGVSLAQAQAAMDGLAAAQAQKYPESNAASGLRLLRLAEAGSGDKTWMWLTMALAGFVLLIACANLANLQFARTAQRTHEIAIRGALGASRGRLLRQLLAESLLLALLGGGAGLLFARWGNGFLGRQLLVGSGTALSLNLGVIGFALLASTISAFAFGLVPAWLASRTNTNEMIKQGSRGAVGDRARHRVQQALIVTEVALVFVLLTGAGLVVRGLQRFTTQNPGWEVDGLTIGALTLPQARHATARQQSAFADRLQEKLAAMPGVEHVAIASCLPVRPFNTIGSINIAGRPEPAPGHEPMGFLISVTPGYFATFEMRVTAGRNFSSADRPEGRQVAIVNETMARAFWPNDSPLGASINGQEIVGVVSDVRFPGDFGEPATRYQIYRPFAQAPVAGLAFALRGQTTAATLRHAVAELEADLAVTDIRTAREAVERSLTKLAQLGQLLTGFGGLGLLLASIGIYGLIAGFVVQRTPEIGVRMALGAEVRDVLWLVVGQGMRLTLLGVSIGLLGAWGIARLIASAAPALESNDPVSVAGVAFILMVVAALACWLPARRAARINPIITLRSQ